MSDQRILGFTWLALAVCLALVLSDLSAWSFAALGIANAELAGGSFAVSTVVGIVLAAATAVVTWRLPKVYAFCVETVQETRKVVWPTRKETKDHTVVVVSVSLAIALLLWGFDLVWKRLFAVILNMGA